MQVLKLLKYLKQLYTNLFTDITSVPAIFQGSYYPALTGLRGVSTLMVLLAHFGLNKYLYPHHIYIDARAAVHIFFVLSGFLITTLLLKEKLKYGHINLRYFYIRRALRILPVVYLFLLILIALNYIFKLHITTINFISSFLFFNNLPLRGSYYTAHLWSLAVEEQFYLTFPILLMLSTNKYTAVTLPIVIMVPLIAIGGYFRIPFLYSSHAAVLLTKLCMYAFWKGPVMILIGSVFSVLLFKRVIRLENIKANYFLSFILLLTALVMRAQNFLFYTKYVSEYLSNILIAFAIILCINKKDFLSTILSNAILLRVGVLSYSLYIWQQLFTGYNLWQPYMHGFIGYPLWALIVLKLVFVFIIANISYYYERKFLRMKDRFEHTRGHNKTISSANTR